MVNYAPWVWDLHGDAFDVGVPPGNEKFAKQMEVIVCFILMMWCFIRRIADLVESNFLFGPQDNKKITSRSILRVFFWINEPLKSTGLVTNVLLIVFDLPTSPDWVCRLLNYTGMTLIFRLFKRSFSSSFSLNAPWIFVCVVFFFFGFFKAAF